ncbi:MAG: serine--tRNA ligase [Planctomycetes bacterium RIFCSPHIGHO2_02_FULL_50_42]|nr:MAG: serine--tRNA ligase [Planctomycetes bacterium RIFCSPHIGHO2_02_FULL_50_42]OHB92097.1 MAG: serine--tRNA ligase [Planctomycetes bacterium RIFCSPHIGHO2_12_FULL_51_37]
MLDLNYVRKHPEEVKRAAKGKHDHAEVDKLLELDSRRRGLIFESEQLRKRLNEASKEIGRFKNEGKDASAQMAEMKDVSDRIKDYEGELRNLDQEMQEILMTMPNIPAADVPPGEDASANELVRSWGEVREFSIKPKPHWELGTTLGILDFERGAKISGAGFPLFKGIGARLERALFNFMLDLHTSRHGYKEVFPPFLVNRTSMTGTGQLPKLEGDMYRITEDDLFLIPTAEVPVTNIHRDEILSHKDLPLYYTAYTACFRREAGAHGKDTRGIIRVHQFNKVELVKFVRPETSSDELESLLKNAEKVLQLLGLPYRVLKLCVGDLSFASSKCYDIEAWAPGVGRWLEVSSCSNFTDFQARRINIRFRDEQGKVQFVHTLNGSGVALPRTVIALLENYQQADGSVVIPDVLRPYTGGVDVITPQ